MKRDMKNYRRYLLVIMVMVVLVFNATFNNISVISWWSVLLVEQNRSTRRKLSTCRKSLTNFITWYCIEYTSPERDSLVMKSTDSIGSCQSNHYTITTTTVPYNYGTCSSLLYWRQWCRPGKSSTTLLSLKFFC